jgi:hypothetical protein
VSTPGDCRNSVPAPWVGVAQAQRAGVAQAHLKNVTYPSTLPWFCDAAGRCPAFVGDAVTLGDAMHLSEEASRSLGPVLRSIWPS